MNNQQKTAQINSSTNIVTRDELIQILVSLYGDLSSCLTLRETTQPNRSFEFNVKGGVDEQLLAAWSRRVGDTKLRILVEAQRVIVKEMETRYHSRAATAFCDCVRDALLAQSFPGTRNRDLPLSNDGTGRKFLSKAYLQCIRCSCRWIYRKSRHRFHYAI